MKRVKNRRRRAIPWLAGAFAALVLANSVFGVGFLLPIQPVWRAEQREGTGRLETVAWVREPELHRSSLVCLRGGDRAVLLGSVYLRASGWSARQWTAVDCADGQPLHAGWMKMTWQDLEPVLYVFGRVDDPEIAAVEISGQTGPERADLVERGGYRYFLVRQFPSDPAGAVPVAVEALDKSGRIAFRLDDVKAGSSAVYGIR